MPKLLRFCNLTSSIHLDVTGKIQTHFLFQDMQNLILQHHSRHFHQLLTVAEILIIPSRGRSPSFRCIFLCIVYAVDITETGQQI